MPNQQHILKVVQFCFLKIFQFWKVWPKTKLKNLSLQSSNHTYMDLGNKLSCPWNLRERSFIAWGHALWEKWWNFGEFGHFWWMRWPHQWAMLPNLKPIKVGTPPGLPVKTLAKLVKICTFNANYTVPKVIWYYNSII